MKYSKHLKDKSMTSTILLPMAWSNDKFRLPCTDNGLKKSLLKMIDFDKNSNENNVSKFFFLSFKL